MGPMRSPKLEQILSVLKDLDPDTYPVVLDAITKLMAGKASAKEHSLLELKGSGKDLWKDVDVEGYIRKERDSWD